MTRAKIAAAATTLLASAMSVSAAALGEYVTIGGFGTVGGVQTDSDEGQFGRDRQIGGADKSADFKVDSNLGLQLTANATKWLSGTVQVLAAKRTEEDIDTRFEWAYVLVKPISGLAVRAGRMALPAFAISDSRNIGYANTWVRAPNEVYALNVFTNFKGLDASYQLPIGHTTLSATVLAGNTSNRIFGFEAEGERVRGLNVQVETDWATFRVGQTKVDVTVPAFNLVDDPYTFTGYGVMIDRNNLVAQAEYVQRRSGKRGAIVDANGWYLMGGWRLGSLLPYAIVSRTAPDAAMAPVYISATQKTTAIGLRWDAFTSAAIKFQIDHIDTKRTTGISFTTPVLPPAGPGLPPRRPVQDPVNVFSVALDFTF